MSSHSKTMFVFYRKGYFFISRHTKKWGILWYTLRKFWVSICLSARCPSALRFQTLTSSFWLIFFKLCMDIDIREEWFGIANGLNMFINNRVMALDWCKNLFFLSIFRTNGWILIKFCICIDKYKIPLINTRSMLFLMHNIFGQFLTMLWPLINVRIFFMINILWINLWISIKFCICIVTDKMQIWMIEQYFLFIFNRVMALDWCWNFLWTNWWILIKFCKCIDTDKMEIRTITNYFSLFLNGVKALDGCQNFVSI